MNPRPRGNVRKTSKERKGKAEGEEGEVGRNRERERRKKGGRESRRENGWKEGPRKDCSEL